MGRFWQSVIPSQQLSYPSLRGLVQRTSVVALLLLLAHSGITPGIAATPTEPDEFPPNPLELTTPDPLLPNPPRPLNAQEQQQLAIACDALNLEAQAKLQAGDRIGAFDLWNRELRLRRFLGLVPEIQALGRVGDIAWKETDTAQVRWITKRLDAILNQILPPPAPSTVTPTPTPTPTPTNPGKIPVTPSPQPPASGTTPNQSSSPQPPTMGNAQSAAIRSNSSPSSSAPVNSAQIRTNQSGSIRVNSSSSSNAPSGAVQSSSSQPSRSQAITVQSGSVQPNLAQAGTTATPTNQPPATTIPNRNIPVTSPTPTSSTTTPPLLNLDPATKIRVLEALGIAYQQVRLPQVAVRIYEQILADARQRRDEAKIESTLITLGQLHLSWFSYDPAATAFRELLDRSRARGDRPYEILYLNQLAYIHEQAKQPEAAIAYQQQLIALYQTVMQDPKPIPALQIRIGDNYYSMGRLDLAEQSYQAAYQLAQPLLQLAHASDSLQKLAALYLANNRLDAALRVYDFLIGVEQQAYNTYGVMAAYDKIGQIYISRKEYPQAILAFRRGLDLARQLKYREDYFTGQIQQAAQQGKAGQ
ncbi:tetratricopeptide repeat protein [Pantanalinema sp. GBBB05]|uniref:tetratricopeptide repeat protein n=1 Tax=Pantanalinema sp. GBBB05 TaxID=2604139 RepID=UPI001DA5148C|nr:tetratricopeptide repeat protein [Pantanalinema sp. GBBB05]